MTTSSSDALAAMKAGFVQGNVLAILRIEGLTVLAVAVTAFAHLNPNWWRFGALFLLPDIAFLAYLVNPRVGATAYNTLHSYIAPLLLGLTAQFAPAPSLMPFALIWTAHLGFDRALGYGLKYPSAFGHTHLTSK